MKFHSLGIAGGLQIRKDDNSPINLTAEDCLKVYRYLKYKHFPNFPLVFDLKEESEIVW